MNKSYLFFDIECANCFDGIGKMCSFGYVLTDENFNVIDTDDVVMNPECEFDWYLFSKKNQCPLAYSKDYFRRQKNFESYYKGIKKLLEESERKVIGFSSMNDVGFVVSAKMKLKEWCEFYKIDLSQITAHKSQDDAMMTMLLAKAFCEEKGISLPELLEHGKGSKISTEKYIEQREKSRRNKELKEKLQSLYGKKCRACLSSRLSGKKIAFGYKISEDFENALKIANLVYKHGGMIFRHLNENGTLLVKDDISEEEINAIESKGFETMTIKHLTEITNLG